MISAGKVTAAPVQKTGQTRGGATPPPRAVTAKVYSAGISTCNRTLGEEAGAFLRLHVLVLFHGKLSFQSDFWLLPLQGSIIF